MAHQNVWFSHPVCISLSEVDCSNSFSAITARVLVSGMYQAVDMGSEYHETLNLMRVVPRLWSLCIHIFIFVVEAKP